MNVNLNLNIFEVGTGENKMELRVFLSKGSLLSNKARVLISRGCVVAPKSIMKKGIIGNNFQNTKKSVNFAAGN